jgi:hypothetical protein
VLGVGKDAAGTTYLADEVPEKSVDRVFVSQGDTLFRKRVNGSGSSGGGADADYTFSFEEGFDAATARALLIQRRGGATTAMALGPANSKGFIGDPGATTENLTVIDQASISSMTLRNLPGTVSIQYVADVDNGQVIVVTQPTDDATYKDFRVFYGTESAMVERTVIDVTRTKGSDTDIRFKVDGAEYIAHFTFNIVPTDGGVSAHPGPATLDTGTATLTATERRPIPTTLPGFSFTCL